MRTLALARREAPERYSPRVCVAIILGGSAAAWWGIIELVRAVL